MKKLLMLLFTSSLLACNNAENKKGQTGISTEDAHYPATSATTLALNNEAKWKADESTNKNVSELKMIAKRLNENKSKTLVDYATVANELQTGLDKMIKQCRMQGPDHEALHQWLEPLLQNVANLEKATDEKKASGFFNAVEEQLKIYHQYFE